MNVPRSFGDNLKDLSKREDPLGRGKSDVDSFSSEMKHTIPAKSLSRGKSVRTIRASKHVVETMKTGEIHPNHIDGKAGKRLESEKDSESEFDNFQLSSDEEETKSDIISDAELGPSEVDRKAGEFIAKFREQIRLQRIASIRG
ncbi:hypothetical protein F0562_019040 [Nyssa sinensis]|uniref:DUF4408 domain-containing protein n=1 Tax=Nyssa sinensis TaxID=561372 RepID=A0A5J4ZEU7_9ASTE|nr:hypothetical protein F0562_019040 [Nyssa sinensis]